VVFGVTGMMRCDKEVPVVDSANGPDRKNSPGARYISALILSLVLFLAGTLYCLYYGRIGYMPMDSSIVFDGGWRILCGQAPFRDFTAPNAIVPALLQAPIFALFGVNWFAYCLHAAVFNGLFCVLAFFFLRLFGGTMPLSFFYALLSGVIFYAPFGTPVQDQHAYFFTFLLIFLTCVSTRSLRLPAKYVLFFSLPIVTVIAYFSKQIPTVLGVVLCLAVLLIAERKSLLGLIAALVAGSLFTLLLLWTVYRLCGINADLVKIYLFQLPDVAGKARVAARFGKWFMFYAEYMVAHCLRFLPFAVVTFCSLLVSLTIGAGYMLGKKPCWRSMRKSMTANLTLPILSQSLVLICLVFVLLTLNAEENGVPLMFISVGLMHLFILNVWSQLNSVRCKEQRKRFNECGISVVLIGFFFYGSSLLCAFVFHENVNKSRAVHTQCNKNCGELVERYRALNESGMSYGKELPAELSFLKWQIPAGYKGSPSDIAHVIKFFQRNRGNFFLVGDSSILYGLTGRPSVSPSLWFLPGSTLPFPNSPLFSDFQHRLMTSLKKYKVRYVVLEEVNYQFKKGFKDGFGFSLAYCPQLSNMVKKEGIERERFGPFTIIELQQKVGKGRM
jgi:hypothetical protein